jgi:hypothetical protein
VVQEQDDAIRLVMLSFSLQVRHAKLWCLILLTSLDIGNSLQTPPFRLDRAVQKAADKLVEFGQHQENHPTLVVDGNNVRGIANFEWNPVELQHRVSLFCQEFGIPRAVVVWDHGSCRFATAPPANNKSQDVDMVIIFSGLSQRADDVMVKESRHLVSSFCGEWSSLAFVTNDGGLTSRLRQTSLNHQKLSRQSHQEDASTKQMPLIIDSTRFVELLSRISRDDLFDSSKYEDDNIWLSMHTVQESLRHFAKLQKLGYNPRREKTWERCVLAETMRRAFCSLDDIQQGGAFAKQYMQDLETRDYANTTSSRLLDVQDDSILAIPGPTRLDKKQKRLLTRYNRAREKGQLGGESKE